MVRLKGIGEPPNPFQNVALKRAEIGQITTNNARSTANRVGTSSTGGSSVAETSICAVWTHPGLGSGNVVAFEFLVHRRAVDAENRGRRFDVAARVLQGRGNEQSFKLLECRADRGAPSQTGLRWSGIDTVRKGARIMRGGDFAIRRFRPRVTTQRTSGHATPLSEALIRVCT
jgi:hypothetical protein